MVEPRHSGQQGTSPVGGIRGDNVWARTLVERSVRPVAWRLGTIGWLERLALALVVVVMLLLELLGRHRLTGKGRLRYDLPSRFQQRRWRAPRPDRR